MSELTPEKLKQALEIMKRNDPTLSNEVDEFINTWIELKWKDWRDGNN